MAITFDNTYLTNYSTDATTAAAEKLTGTIQNAVEDEEMLDACKEFEAYMVEQIYKNMEKISKILTDDDEEDKEGSEYLDMFSDTYLQDISSKMMSSGQSLGLAEQLYNSIKVNSGQAATATEAVDTTSAVEAVSSAVAATTTD